MITYDLTKRGKKSKTLYLYESVRDDIYSGTLERHSRLPSKRELASHLNLSVITVENAYRMLESDGLIEAKNRSGFYVADLDFIKYQRHKENPEQSFEYLREEPQSLSESWFFDNNEKIEGVSKIIRKTLSEHPDIFTRVVSSEGSNVLRNTICDYLKRFRGLKTRPQNIIIGAGSEYLYRLCVQLLGQDKRVGIEDPSYEKIEKIYRSLGVAVEHLKMGPDGIETQALLQSRADYIHVTPYHSYPSGVTASMKKRYEYLEIAKRRNLFIIEDDFDSEISFFYRPMDTLYQTDSSNRVIYINTFTKSIAPGMRVAYMVLPDSLLKVYRERLSFLSCPVPVFIQYALSAYIAEGYFERHISRMRRRNQE